jgi:hypothetical protein
MGSKPGRKSKESQAGWGAKVIDRLAHDLREAFPAMKGFSPRNLKYMRAFAAAWTEKEIVQQLTAQIPWTHNCVLLDKLSSPSERRWYIEKILSMQIQAQAHKRQGKAKNRVVVEYALRDLAKPIGVAEWETRIVKSLPEEFASCLPTTEEIEAELARGEGA